MIQVLTNKYRSPILVALGAVSIAAVTAAGFLPQALAFVVGGAIVFWAIVHYGKLFYLYIYVSVLVPSIIAVRPVEGLPAIFPYRVVLLMMGVGYLLNLGRTSKLVWHDFFPLFVLIVVTALSVWGSEDPQATLVRFVFFLAEWGLFYLVALSVLRRQSYMQWVIALAWLGIIVTLWGVSELVTGLRVGDWLVAHLPAQLLANQMDMARELFRWGFRRVFASFAHPIILGAFMALIAPLMLERYLFSPRHKAFFGIVFLMITFSEVMCFSTTPWIGYLVGVGLVLWRAFRAARSRVLLFTVLATWLTMILLLAIGQPLVSGVIANTFSRFDPSSPEFLNTAGRIAILIAAWDYVVQRPLFGWGVGSWVLLNPKATFMGATNVGVGNENFYAQWLVETGVVGMLVFFGWVLPPILRRSPRRQAGMTRLPMWVFACKASLIAGLMMSLGAIIFVGLLAPVYFGILAVLTLSRHPAVLMSLDAK